MSRKKKGSQNKLFNDFNAESDDFVLADLNTGSSDQELSPVPLTTFNDDDATIDRLLINSNIESKEGDDEQTLSDDVLLIDDVDVTDDFSDSDRFVVGPIEHEEEPKVGVKDTIGSKNTDLKFDREIQELYFKDEKKPEEVIPEASVRKIKVSINKRTDKAPTPDLANEIRMPKAFSFKNEKKNYQSDDFGVQIKKVTHFNYVALGLSSAALLLGLFVSYKILHLEDKISKLSDLTSILEEDVSTLIEKSSALGNPNVGSTNTANTGQESTHLKSPPEPIIKNDKPIASADKVEERVNPNIKKKVPTPIFEKPTKTKVKKVELPADKAVKTVLLNERPKKGKALLVANKNSLSSHDAHKASGHEAEKTHKKQALENKKPVKPVVVASHNPKPKEPPSGPEWVVSLIAYDNEHFAKRKAARLINQGIPVKVIPIHANKDKWYQLKVGGFKNKESAESYASKVKKSLKLSMVAVSFQ